MYLKWQLGSHVPFETEISSSLLYALDRNMRACQIYMGGKTSYQRAIITKEDIEYAIKIQNENAIRFFTHFHLKASLVGSKASIAWEDDNRINGLMKYMMKHLEYELSVVANFKCSGVVIHPGYYEDVGKGLKAISTTINKINFSSGSLLLLENCAGEKNRLCKDFEQIGTVINNVIQDKQKNVGVCVDTAHIWGQGDYDLRECDEIDRMFDDFDAFIGIDKFKLLHLNDSKVDIGSKKDRHASIGTGYIWKNDDSSLLYLLDKCEELGIPQIMETSENDMITMFNRVNK
jgi:deoxyribonuclease-4